MSDNNGWPDKPGVPMNPEQSRWHWLCAKLGDPEPFYWNGNFWPGPDQWSTITFSQSTSYLGPCLTPAEVDARIATARKDAPTITGKHVEHPGNGARLTTLGQPVGKGEGDE
jgi:hypothetical protein